MVLLSYNKDVLETLLGIDMDKYESIFASAEQNSHLEEHELLALDFEYRSCGGLCGNMNDGICEGWCHQGIEGAKLLLPEKKAEKLRAGEKWIPLILLGESPEEPKQAIENDDFIELSAPLVEELTYRRPRM